jgi:hypothetical protein
MMAGDVRTPSVVLFSEGKFIAFDAASFLAGWKEDGGIEARVKVCSGNSRC